MASSSAEPHLAAIPETRPTDDLPGSALASPRSTSDSPGRGSAPISPTSRLLRPTLSWQAKAGWIPEAPTALCPTPTSIDSNVDVSSGQMQEPTVALKAPDQATTAAGRLSPSVSARWQSMQNNLQPSQDATGMSSSDVTDLTSKYALLAATFTLFGDRALLHGCAPNTQGEPCVAGNARNTMIATAQAQQPSHSLVCFLLLSAIARAGCHT